MRRIYRRTERQLEKTYFKAIARNIKRINTTLLFHCISNGKKNVSYA